MRAVPARIFIEQNNSYRLLESVTIEDCILDLEIADSTGAQIRACTLRGWLPAGWNPYRPQNLHLVYQDTDDAKQFFDPQKFGHLCTLTGFRIIGDDNVLMLVRNVATGEVTVPTPEYQCTFVSELETDDEVNHADT